MCISEAESFDILKNMGAEEKKSKSIFKKWWFLAMILFVTAAAIISEIVNYECILGLGPNAYSLDCFSRAMT